jgi:ribosomal protein S18 acetylase RimI-like enzyme
MTIEFRPLAATEIGEAVRLWESCGRTRPWNDPAADARRALDGPSSAIFASFAAGHLVGTAMCGWDGHCGWIDYLGVDSDFRRFGFGRKLIWHCEDWLAQFGAPKVQLIVSSENKATARFLEAIGYEADSFGFFYRRDSSKRHREQQSEAP